MVFPFGLIITGINPHCTWLEGSKNRIGVKYTRCKYGDPIHDSGGTSQFTKFLSGYRKSRSGRHQQFLEDKHGTKEPQGDEDLFDEK